MTRRAALLGLGTVAVSGCSFEPVTFSPTTAPAPSPSVDPTVVLDPEFYVRSKDGSAKTLMEGNWTDQRFSTPHLDGTLVNCFVGDSLSAATASQVALETAVRPPDGYELAAFTLQGGRPSFTDTVEHAASVQLRIDDRRIPVEQLFESFSIEDGRYLSEWEMISFCLPEGDEIVLEVTDESRTIALDLRTGVPLVDADWEATTGFRERWHIECEPVDGVFSREFTTMPPPGLDPESGELLIGLQPDMINGLLPWTPTQGWAPEGQQWLAVPMNARVDWTSRVPPQFTLRPPQSLQYLDEDGERVAAVHPESITTEQIATGLAELLAVWPVTGGGGPGSIHFTAVGELEVDYTDAGRVPAQFTSPVEAVEFALTFSPVQR